MQKISFLLIIFFFIQNLYAKEEYFLTLMSYISEYQERHGQETIIRG